jgi:hypothetical protein
MPQVTRGLVGGSHDCIGAVWRRWLGIHVNPHPAQYDQECERNERRHNPKPSPQPGNVFRASKIFGLLGLFRLGKLVQEFCRPDDAGPLGGCERVKALRQLRPRVPINPLYVLEDGAGGGGQPRHRIFKLSPDQRAVLHPAYLLSLHLTLAQG